MLADDLKEGTKSEHRNAEKSKFVKYFLKGQISREVYGRFLCYLYHVYCTLEKCVDLYRDNEHIRHVYFPEQLNRKEAIEQDLEYFVGPAWRNHVNDPLTSPALQAYLTGIQECCVKDPALLIAHLYTRYLGDLSGGQILAKRLIKHMDLPQGEGTAFYRFDKIETPTLFKQVYRGRLNQIQMNKELLSASIEEAKRAFNYNIGIFIEFDPDAGKMDDPKSAHVKRIEKTLQHLNSHKREVYLFLFFAILSVFLWNQGFLKGKTI